MSAESTEGFIRPTDEVIDTEPDHLLNSQPLALAQLFQTAHSFINRLTEFELISPQAVACTPSSVPAYCTMDYGSTVTSTNAGKLSAPLLSVTRNLKRYVRGSETGGARNEASELLASSSGTLLPRT